MKFASIILVLFILLGCTSKGTYEGIQASNQIECFKLPSREYDECMARVDKSYEEYERQRREVLQNTTPK